MVSRHQPLWQPERPAATRSEFRTAGVGGREENVACIFHQDGIGAKRSLRRMGFNEWQECNVTGNNNSFPAWVTSTERTLCKSYSGSLGLSYFSSADPEGRYPANKKIHERGSGSFDGREESDPVISIGMQFRPNGSPLCV